MRFVALALAIGTAAGGCATNPATGRSQVMLISEAQEIAMGREYDQVIVASIGLYPDPALQTYIQRLGAQLAATGERPNLPWTFRVVDDPTVNAFAVPGGFIYVTRGLMAHLNSEAELAAVVGHEIGHVTARHTVSQMSNQQLAGLGLGIGSILSSDVARYADVAGAAVGILFLKHSRDDEREADDLGLRYLRRGNFDPRAMPDVFVMLERVSAFHGGGRVPEWLATHPSPANRRENIANQIAALPQDFAGTTVNHESYIQRLDGQVFGVNPREGFTSGAVFQHPDLRFQIAFPQGWAVNNGKQAVVAVSEANDGAVELTMASEASAEAAAQAFFGQEGLTSGAVSRAQLHGLPASRATFTVAAEGGRMDGSAVFVEHGGAVFRLLGYAPSARWSAYRAIVEQSLISFQPLTNAAALAVQPHRLVILRLASRTTITTLAGQRPSPTAGDVLALINQVEVGTSLASGQLIKWVVGRPTP
ncbi:MAG: M48 family metalloprotease [Gemmatimonadales bacterium]